MVLFTVFDITFMWSLNPFCLRVQSQKFEAKLDIWLTLGWQAIFFSIFNLNFFFEKNSTKIGFNPRPDIWASFVLGNQLALVLLLDSWSVQAPADDEAVSGWTNHLKSAKSNLENY